MIFPFIAVYCDMFRVNRRVCEDEPTPEEQETEGQRQLRNLLIKQLDTDVDFDR